MSLHAISICCLLFLFVFCLLSQSYSSISKCTLSVISPSRRFTHAREGGKTVISGSSPWRQTENQLCKEVLREMPVSTDVLRPLRLTGLYSISLHPSFLSRVIEYLLITLFGFVGLFFLCLYCVCVVFDLWFCVNIFFCSQWFSAISSFLTVFR